MTDPITRLNAALEGRYTIERELGEGGGWKDRQSLKFAYQQSNTETMLRAVMEAGELREVR